MLTPKSDLYWAVVEHVRTWLGEDGPFRQIIDAKNGELDGSTLRRISIIYNVNRGIKAKEGNIDAHADALAEMLNKARPWPVGLVERAEKCLEVALDAKKQGHTKTLQASAITKFSWFAQPSSWTVYDRFVARAMNIKDGETGERMVLFYRQLDRRCFLELAKQIQAVLNECAIMELHGTRVLDKLMMVTGAKRGQEQDWAEKNIILQCHGFLNLLPTVWRQAVSGLAECVDSRIQTSEFLQS